MHRTIVVAALAAPISLGCAHGSLNSAEGWTAIDSKHLTVYAPDTNFYQPTMVTLEYAYAAVGSSFFFKNSDIGKVDVLYLDDEEFVALMGARRHAAVLEKAPGNGKIGRNGLIISKADPNGSYTGQMMGHLYLHKLLPKAPLWFHEGFASYLGTLEYKEGEGLRRGCFGKPGGGADGFVTVEELIAASWDEYDDKHKGWYRHTAEAVIDYIIHGEDKKFIGQLGPLMDGFSKGTASGELIAAAFPGVSTSDLNTKIVEHGKEIKHQSETGAKVRGECPIGFDIPDDKAPDKAENPKMSPADPVEMQKLLDGLKKLPRREGYPPWYPADVIDRVNAAPKT